jgi:hypothetical protein
MKRTVITASAVAGVALAGLTLTACGSSPPAYQDKITCTGLATATTAVASGGYGVGGGNTYTPIAQDQELIWQAPSGTFSSDFRRDLLAVTGNPAKAGYGNYVPSPQQVSKLQGDCANLGVHGRIWPTQLTGN